MAIGRIIVWMPGSGPYTVLSWLVIGFFAGLPTAFAECHWNWDKTFYGCDGIGILNGVGLSLPTVHDVLQVNPASIPSVPTPVGVEAIYNTRTDAPGAKREEVSIIRGFKGIGIGLGTWNGSSFATPDLGQLFGVPQFQAAYQSALQQDSKSPGYRFGTSVEIPHPIESLGHFSVGAAAGQTPTSNSLSRSIGTNWALRWMNAGFSYNIERVAKGLPEIKTSTLTAGLQYDEVSLNFSRVGVDAGGPQPVTSIYSVRWLDDTWSAYTAMRTYVNDIGNTQLCLTGSVHRSFGRHLAIGYIYGRYQHSHSMSAQFYF